MRFARIMAAAFAAAALLPLSVAAQYDHQKENTLRIMSYNVLNGLKLDHKTINYSGQMSIIERTAPDVAAIEEVDSMTERSRGHYLLGEYASYLGMHGYYSPAIDFQGGRYGMGLLSKRRPLSIRRLPLPGREEARTVIIAEYDRYVIAATHFSLNDTDRIASLDIICREADRYAKPFFLAGDLNATPESGSGKVLASRFQLLTDPKAHTFPADKPTETIDYIALYKNRYADAVCLLSRGVINAPDASDHRPVYADVRFKTPADKLLCAPPYLQNFSSTGVTVMFQINAPVHTWVEYGTDTLHMRRARTLLAGQEPCFDIENKIRLDSLRSGRRYYYRVCMQEVLINQAYYKLLGDTVRTPLRSFTLPSPEDDSFTAIVLNDLHERDDVMRSLLNVVRQNGISYDLVFFNGDCVPEPDSRANAIERVNALFSAVGADSCHAIIIRGNHEIRNSYSAGMLSLTDNFDGKTYGAFSWGDTRFVVLDCGEDKPDNTWVYYGLNDFSQLRKDQTAFLRKELSGREYKKARRHILLNHIPIWGADDVYTDGYHPWTAMWSPLLVKAGFDVNLVAHAHFFYSYDKGVKGNPCLCVGGGGPSMDGKEQGTVMVLQKNGGSLRLRVFNTHGAVLFDRML